MKKITLSDIAKKTGYSVNTVSHALRDMKDISKEVKKHINDTAAAMGYIPNISAGVLRGGKTMSVAIIVKDISIPYYAVAVKEMEKILQKRGYSAFVMNTNGNEETERTAIIRALSQNVDGIILCPVLKTKNNIDFLTKNDTPYILFGTRSMDKNISYVAPDFTESGYLATKALTELGHSKILFLGYNDYTANTKDLAAGIKKALKEAALDDALLAQAVKSSDEDTALTKVLSDSYNYSAIICYDGILALRVCKALNLQEKNIPDDISVIAIGESGTLLSLLMPLTSIGAPIAEMAVHSVVSLLDIIGSKKEAQQIIVSPEFFDGETIKEPSRRFKNLSRRQLSDYLL